MFFIYFKLANLFYDVHVFGFEALVVESSSLTDKLMYCCTHSLTHPPFLTLSPFVCLSPCVWMEKCRKLTLLLTITEMEGGPEFLGCVSR